MVAYYVKRYQEVQESADGTKGLHLGCTLRIGVTRTRRPVGDFYQPHTP